MYDEKFVQNLADVLQLRCRIIKRVGPGRLVWNFHILILLRKFCLVLATHL